VSRPLSRSVLIPVLLTARCGFGGDGTLEAPLRLGTGPSPVTLTAGDFNRDGRPDLAAANGSSQITVLLQGETRVEWALAPALNVGNGNFFVRAADFNGDGAEDLAIADPGSYAYVARSKGDGSFERPVTLTSAPGARWIAAQDWNGDGFLDLVSANYNALTYSLFWGKGDGTFTFAKAAQPAGRPHAVEAMDFDGDGKPDLMVGLQAVGILPLRSLGNGNFEPRPLVTNLGCVRYIATGDFNGDRKADLASSCVGEGTGSAGTSNGDGTYRQTLFVDYGSGDISLAIADFNRDGFDDLALTSNQNTTIQVHPAKGDGTFRPKVDLQSTGQRPFFLSAADLDLDGVPDLISADSGGSGLTVFWGTGGDGLLQTARAARGFGTTRAVALGDLDGDSWPDLFIARSDQARVHLYLKPGEKSLAAPSLTITTTAAYSALLTVDLDQDGVPDLAGLNASRGLLLTAVLERSGAVRAQQSLPAGTLPSGIAAGSLDQDSWPDLAVASTGSATLWVFLNRGTGEFAEGKPFPTIDVPRDLAAGDLDRDGKSDLAEVSSTRVAIQYGLGGGDFGGPALLAEDSARAFSKVVLGDLEGDGNLDLLASEGRSQSVFVWRGRGNRAFAPAEEVKLIDLTDPIRVLDRLFLGGEPLSCPDAADANDDGELNLTDVIAVLDRLFLGGEPLPPPGPEQCGFDPAPDFFLECRSGC
jgi:hypothetical protein